MPFTRDKYALVPALVDAEIIGSLRAILRDDFESVMDSFTRNTRRYLSLIELALSENDRVSLIMTAHKLASSAGQVGFMKLSEFAREIEMKAGHAPVTELKRTYNRAEKAYAEALKALESMSE